MSLMEDPKQSLPALLEQFEELRQQVRAAEKAIILARENLDRMFGAGPTPQPDPLAKKPRRYAVMDPLTAVQIFLEQQGHTMTEAEIVEELMDGKVKTGSDKMSPVKVAGNIKRSLFANSKTAKSPLVKIGDRYGLREWPKEKLKPE